MSRPPRFLALALVAAIVASACSGGGGGEAEAATPTAVPTVANQLPPTPTPVPIPDNAIRVGVLLDTGSQDASGVDPGNIMSGLDRAPGVAFQAQIEAINEAGGLLGRPIAIIQVDSTSRRSVIDRAAEDMIDAGVDLIVVTCEFDFAEPAIQRAEEAGVLVISPCAAETGWTSGAAGELAFSMVPPVQTYGLAMADYMWDQGYRNVAVVSDQSAPEARAECGAFAERWRELGGTFQYSEAFTLRAADNLDDNAQVRRAADADAIAFCAFSIIGRRLLGADPDVSGIRAMNIDVPIVAGPSFDTGTWLPLDFPGLGVFRLLALSSVHGDDPVPAVATAIDGFTAIDTARPQSGRFVLGADVADLWAQAVVAAGTTDGRAVAEALRAMRAVETISGSITFGGSQAPESRQLRVLRHSNGRLVFEEFLEARQDIETIDADPDPTDQLDPDGADPSTGDDITGGDITDDGGQGDGGDGTAAADDEGDDGGGDGGDGVADG